jgi:hypothetical protein
MNEIKKIIHKVYLLIIDILRFSYKTASQVILPNRRKKGNLLSILFNLFVGIIERVAGFEYGVFLMANILKRKYIKQSLIIVTGFLFLLTSVEWTGDKNINTNSGDYITQFSDTVVKKVKHNDQKQVIVNSKTTYIASLYPAYKSILHRSTTLTLSVKAFLIIHCFRI